MKFLNIRHATFPLFVIEVGDNSGWRRFTVEPFMTENEAVAHKLLCEEEYARAIEQSGKRFRVARYKREDWKRDLLKVVAEGEPELIRAVLSSLEPEVLCDGIDKYLRGDRS